MTVKLLTEHYLEFLSFKGGCTDSSESIHMSIRYIVGNHMSRLNLFSIDETYYCRCSICLKIIP